MDEIEKIHVLQGALCATREGALSAMLASNTRDYITLRGEELVDQQFQIPDKVNTTHGFLLCCIDSLQLLCAHLPAPPDAVLSVTHQNTFTQIIELLVGFGVEQYCDKGVCPVVAVTQVDRYIRCPVNCNVELEKIAGVLQELVNDNLYGSLILSRYHGVLLAICIQVVYGPNNPRRVIKQNKDPGKVATSLLIDTDKIKHFLEDLLYKAHVTSVVKELVSLQLPKAASKPPVWLLAVTNDLLGNQVIRPNGVMNVTRALFEQYDNVLSYEDQSFCDKISQVIVTPPKHNPGAYITNITEQVGEILNLSNKTLKAQYLRLHKNLVHKLSTSYPDQTYQIIWCKLFKPCVLWTENQESGDKIAVSESEFEEIILTIETLANFGLFQCALSDRLCLNFLYPLLQLYHHLYQSISHLKNATLNIIKELMSASSCWCDVMLDFVSCDLTSRRHVLFSHGPRGGVQLKSHDNAPEKEEILSLDPEDILGSNDKIVDITINILKPMTSNDQLSNFFLRIFKDITLNLDSDTLSKNFLDVRDEFSHIQASLRKALLIDQLCQNFGQKLLKNTTQTIELLKTIIVQKSENLGSEKDELLLVSFGIVSTYMREEIELSEADEEDIKSLMGPLLKIADGMGNNEVASMANDLRICIATKINLETISSYKCEENEDKKVKLSDIIRDLGDPLLPSRAHAIMQLGKKFEAKEAEVTENVAALQKIVLDNLAHDDSYLFLAAVKCLAQMSWYRTDMILDTILHEIKSCKRKEDDRAKCMEVLVKIMNITNEMLPKYEAEVFSCLLGCVTRQYSELLRVSSLSSLAELCTICTHASRRHLQEILQVSELTLLEDESSLAKKAAIMLLASILQAHDKQIFYQLESDILRIYRLLKRVSSSCPDSEVQTHALFALGLLSNIVRHFMFPKTQIKHEIKIL